MQQVNWATCEREIQVCSIHRLSTYQAVRLPTPLFCNTRSQGSFLVVFFVFLLVRTFNKNKSTSLLEIIWIIQYRSAERKPVVAESHKSFAPRRGRRIALRCDFIESSVCAVLCSLCACLSHACVCIRYGGCVLNSMRINCYLLSQCAA